jgi:rhodanese-related sulfurtransferase
MTGFREIPIADFTSVVDADTQLIDVREPHEVAAGTLDGATNIPLGSLVERLHELDKARRTIVFCRSAARSAQAAQFLVNSGFDDVINLAGGMLAHEQGAPR